MVPKLGLHADIENCADQIKYVDAILELDNCTKIRLNSAIVNTMPFPLIFT